jgi:hypothetical protein
VTAASTTGGLLRLAGDVSGSFEPTRWGALVSALVLITFIAHSATAVLRWRHGGGPRRRVRVSA